MEAIAAEHIDAGTKTDSGLATVAADAVKRVGAMFPDPLDEDDAGDEIVLTTRRAIGRVALVAAETAGRFQREAVEHDPMAWLWAPRAVFDGAAAIDACLDRDACMRGILLHGLGLGLNTDRAALEALMAHDDDDDDHDDLFDERGFGHPRDAPTGRGGPARDRAASATRLRLYTATIIDTRDNRMTQAFHASVARDVPEVRARLAGRFGPDIADAADIRLGVHVAAPAVLALVPGPVLELIRRTQKDPGAPTARTFAIDIEMAI